MIILFLSFIDYGKSKLILIGDLIGLPTRNLVNQLIVDTKCILENLCFVTILMNHEFTTLL